MVKPNVTQEPGQVYGDNVPFVIVRRTGLQLVERFRLGSPGPTFRFKGRIWPRKRRSSRTADMLKRPGLRHFPEVFK